MTTVLLAHVRRYCTSRSVKSLIAARVPIAGHLRRGIARVGVLRACALAVVFALSPAYAQEEAPVHAQSAPRVLVQTSMGSFVIALNPQRAPLTVANFLEYVRAGHYDGTIFHRVVGNFIVQGGGYDQNYVERPTRPDVPNESGNGLSNLRGSVGLARAGDAHSGDAQFYINIADNAMLDPQPSRWGYAVFGQVVEGMRVVDDIGAVATGEVGPFDRDAPLKPIVIERVEELPGDRGTAP